MGSRQSGMIPLGTGNGNPCSHSSRPDKKSLSVIKLKNICNFKLLKFSILLSDNIR